MVIMSSIIAYFCLSACVKGRQIIRFKRVEKPIPLSVAIENASILIRIRRFVSKMVIMPSIIAHFCLSTYVKGRQIIRCKRVENVSGLVAAARFMTLSFE
jgi:hypothetical protein